MDLTTIEGIQRQLKRLSQQICCANSSVSELPVIQSGTYTPTIINNSNISSSFAYDSQYMRVGQVVNLSGALEITVTTPGGVANLSMSLPVATSAAQAEQISGAAILDNAGNVRVIQNNGGNAEIGFVSPSGTCIIYFNITYLIQAAP